MWRVIFCIEPRYDARVADLGLNHLRQTTLRSELSSVPRASFTASPLVLSSILPSTGRIGPVLPAFETLSRMIGRNRAGWEKSDVGGSAPPWAPFSKFWRNIKTSLPAVATKAVYSFAPFRSLWDRPSWAEADRFMSGRALEADIARHLKADANDPKQSPKRHHAVSLGFAIAQLLACLANQVAD